jgi:hypothetical protein
MVVPAGFLGPGGFVAGAAATGQSGRRWQHRAWYIRWCVEPLPTCTVTSTCTGAVRSHTHAVHSGQDAHVQTLQSGSSRDHADALVEALDAGTVQLERNGPIQKSPRGIWMRYDFQAAGGCSYESLEPLEMCRGM